MEVTVKGFQRNRFNQIMLDFFSMLLQSVPIAHTYTNVAEARLAMGQLLHYHSTMARELCTCHVCTVITNAYDLGVHRWQFCEDPYRCALCYHLVGETMHILLPEHWPSWMKRFWSPLDDLLREHS